MSWGLVHNLPVWLTDAYLLHFHLYLRQRYLKKLERDSKRTT